MNNCNNCNCPPDYTFQPAPLKPCLCCPVGYIYNAPTPNYPDGYCSDGKYITITIPCNTCAEVLFTDCAMYNGDPLKCLGIYPGMNLNTVLEIMEKYCELLSAITNKEAAIQLQIQQQLQQEQQQLQEQEEALAQAQEQSQAGANTIRKPQ